MQSELTFEFYTPDGKQYDFNNIDLSDVDVNKDEDLEKYVLTHIYYITQKAKANSNSN